MITGATHILAMIGSPVRHVHLPAYFNRYFMGAQIDCHMIAMDVHPSALVSCAGLARGWQNLIGCVVTMPHKQAITKHIDVLSPRARALGSANVVRREKDGRLIGDMMDGLGFLAAAERNGFRAKGQRALVVGAGAAGSAIAYALCEAGVAELAIIDVAADRTIWLTSLLQRRFPGTTLSSGSESLSGFDLIVNATPVGMVGNSGTSLPIELLHTLPRAALVADLVTAPQWTELLAFASAKGCKVQFGAEMACAQVGLLGAAMGLSFDLQDVERFISEGR